MDAPLQDRRYAILTQRKSVLTTAVVVTLSVGIVAKGSDVPRAARETIAKANADWLVAMKHGDAAATVEPYADDAVFVTATGEAVRGRATIEQLMRERFAKSGNALDGSIIEDGLTREGSLIYEWVMRHCGCREADSRRAAGI